MYLNTVYNSIIGQLYNLGEISAFIDTAARLRIAVNYI